MQQKKQTEFYDVPNEAVSEGVIMEGVLSHYVSPKTAISYAENMHNDTVGMMTSRRPLVSRLTPTANVLSCYQHSDSQLRPYVVWQEGSTYRTAKLTDFGAATSDASKLDATYRARYDTFANVVLMTPPTSGGQLLYASAGATPTAIGGTAFPTGMNLISAGFDQRIWMADGMDSNCYIYYTNPIAGAASTATGGTGFIKVQTENNDTISALIKTQRCLYVFTQNNIFQVFNTANLDNAPTAYVGAYSQEGIVRAKNGYYFYHPTGVFFLQPGGQPQEISVKVKDILNKVPSTNYAKVFGWQDADHVTFCLGNNLQGYQADKTYYVRYTISTQVWTIYSTLGFLPSCAYSKFIGRAVYTTYGGTDILTETIEPVTVIFGNALDTTGAITTTRYAGTFNVFTPSTENSAITPDWGTIPIPVEFQTNWMNFEPEIPESHDHRANGLFIASENANGLKVAYQINNDLPNVWREIGVIGDRYITAFNSWQSEEFNRIKFRVYGQTNGKTVKVSMPKIRVLDDLGYRTN